jgi:hypothetical protein
LCEPTPTTNSAHGERRGLSYAIGMSTTKLFEAMELGVPWLVHVDPNRTTLGLGLRPGRSGPDLVGPRDPGARLDWIVVLALTIKSGHRLSTVTAACRRPFAPSACFGFSSAGALLLSDWEARLPAHFVIRCHRQEPSAARGTPDASARQERSRRCFRR